MRIPLLFIFVAACASAPDEQTKQESLFGEACGLLPTPCIGWPTSTLVSPDDLDGVKYCSKWCGLGAYCPQYPDREIDYCAAHPHENSYRCGFGLPHSRMYCHAGFIATQPVEPAK